MWTIGQLVYDNSNYQKQLKAALIHPRRGDVHLLPVAVNFIELEDFKALKISVEIDGCAIQNVPVDREFGLNLLLESTDSDLGYTVFETTNQSLWMANQSKRVSVGKLSGIPTRITGLTYNLNYLVIHVEEGRPFSMLLGRPWLYLEGVKVNWAKKAFSFGNLAVSLSWRPEDHKGETRESDCYTLHWINSEASDSIW